MSSVASSNICLERCKKENEKEKERERANGHEKIGKLFVSSGIKYRDLLHGI